MSFVVNDRLLTEVAEIHDLVAKLHAKLLADARTTAIDEAPDIPSLSGPIVDNAIAMGRRDRRAADPGALEPGPIDEGARRPRDAVGHAIASRLGILEHASRAR